MDNSAKLKIHSIVTRDASNENLMHDEVKPTFTVQKSASALVG
jgi:hypothetical protein